MNVLPPPGHPSRTTSILKHKKKLDVDTNIGLRLGIELSRFFTMPARRMSGENVLHPDAETVYDISTNILLGLTAEALP